MNKRGEKAYLRMLIVFVEYFTLFGCDFSLRKAIRFFIFVKVFFFLLLYDIYLIKIGLNGISRTFR